MGLAFLNKKSWHTGSFQNIEKVWIAEQKENERKRQIKEAQRRLKEERHYEDLKRLQVEAGLIPKSHLQRLDWMYEGGAIKNTSSEEYLLGKPLKSNENSSGEWRPTLFKESTANPGNEVFTKVHEDPMFAIMQEEQRRRKEIMQNPQKMNKVKKEIEKMKKKRKVSDVSSVVSEDSTKSQKKRRERSRYKEIQETEKFVPDWKSKSLVLERNLTGRNKAMKQPPISPILTARDILQPSQGCLQRRILHPELAKYSLV